MNEAKQLRENATKIFQGALEAANPQKAVLNRLRLQGDELRVGDKSYNLNDYTRILLGGVGNYSAYMSQAVEQLLGDRLQGGMVITRYTLGFTLDKTEVMEAGFPIPDQSSVMGTEKLKSFLKEADRDSLVIFLLSKGAPSLSTVPVEGLKLAEKLETVSLLRKSGASLREIYTVQKHLSQSKGGQLAKVAYPATMPTLIMSDLLDDDFSLVCAGLTFPDESTFAETRSIIDKYGLLEQLPRSVVEYIKAGARGEREETPKPGEEVFRKVENLVVASNLIALESGEKIAKKLGYNTVIFPTFLHGEAREMGRRYGGLVKHMKTSGKPVTPPACLLFGGETAVTRKGGGRGGPNQEVALSAAIELAGTENFALLQSSTTGSDGNSDVSGAIVHGGTMEEAKNMGLDPKRFLEHNDPYHFFKQTGDIFVTGATDTDVMDIGVILVEP